MGRPPSLCEVTEAGSAMDQGANPETRWAHWMGFGVGLLLVVAALYAWRPPTWHGAPAGANVAFAAAPTGELEVKPAGRFLAGSNLLPNRPGVAGILTVRNQTGVTLAVQLRAIASAPDLDGILNIEVSSLDRILFRGQLGKLRDWTTQSIVLRPGLGQSLTFRAWVPAGTAAGNSNGVDSMTVQFLSTPVEG
jgi:hypothetical protein